MGATGSRCACFEKWWVLTDQSTLQDKVTSLDKKYTTMETNMNTLHTKYSTLELKYEQIQKKYDTLSVKIDIVEKKASTMLFTQDEPDCDIVILQ